MWFVCVFMVDVILKCLFVKGWSCVSIIEVKVLRWPVRECVCVEEMTHVLLCSALPCESFKITCASRYQHVHSLSLTHSYPLSFVDLPLSVSHLSLCPSLIPYLTFHAHSCNLPVFLTLLMCLFLVSAPAKFLFKSIGLLKMCGVQKSETTSENPSYLHVMDRWINGMIDWWSREICKVWKCYL